MKKQFIFGLIVTSSFYSSILAAADTSEIINESAATNSVLMGTQAIDRLNKGANYCSTTKPFEKSAPTTSCSVAPDEVANSSQVILQYDHVNQIPEPLKKELELSKKDLSKWKKVYVSIGFENDNIQLIGLAKASDTSAGDDLGFTSASKISTGGVYKDIYDIKATVTGNLYTQEISGTSKKLADGNTSVQQKFRNETIFEIMASNAREGKLKYWDASVGLVNISSKEHFGALDGSWQQRKFHSFLGGMKANIAKQIQHVDDGQKDQWGAYAGAMIGVQKQLELGNRCSVKVQGSVGGQISTLDRHSFIKSVVASEARYKTSEKGYISAGVEASATRHAAGTLTEQQLKLAYNTGKSVEVSFIFKKSQGQLMDYVSYNSNNIITNKPDSTVGLYVKYYPKGQSF